MDIAKIDKNFEIKFDVPEDVQWLSVNEKPFSIHGVTYSENEKTYRRLPKEIADVTNEGVAYLSTNTAGGRIRFATNSPYISIWVEEPFENPASHMTIAGKYGVSLFVDHQFAGTAMPSYEEIVKADPKMNGSEKIVFGKTLYLYNFSEGINQVEVFLPLYSNVTSICIGLQKGAILQEPKAYKHSKPVLFYGSSITQGGCANKPGDDYVNRLSRMLDTDILNLGFSGSAKAEKVIAEYIASQNPSIFVLDYDHNAPDAEHLKNTHFALYETVRNANPNTPIILMTMPTIEGYEDRPWNKPRRDEILKSYAKAKELGDENLYLIDCYGCFGKQVNGECGTIDDCHPDSLGFLRMAERMYPVVNKLLNGEN